MDKLYYALRSVQELTEMEVVTNLQPIFREWQLDNCLPTVISGMGLVEKRGKNWHWVGGLVDDDLVELVRETANIYKNYSY